MVLIYQRALAVVLSSLYGARLETCLSIYETYTSKNVSALKEAFEIFCNNGVAGSSRAELLATFCDLKGGSEKLINEVIEDMLEKVVKLLAYISDKDLHC
ncbi:hypothetical protein CTI12_AA089790 [Artemisia annua]|uniref:Cullin N-terminal domain-containing protein n=1 Tax=Artemisia annua TaxID=35608 RepID=A0A2U1PZK1_ARTAN|nr:hypothetical protein CTI12_AA089790 [Artemisia annua]